MPTLRAYQIDAAERVNDEIIGPRRRSVLVSPTGAGKTVIAGKVIANTIERGQRVLFVGHRREITSQTCRKVYEAGVADFGVIQAGFPMRLEAPVQIASIQTLHARAVRGSAIELPPADVLVVDECHHAAAITYQMAMRAYPGAAIVGLTATPCRGDGRGLGGIFDIMVETPQVAELISGGYLVGTKVFAPSRPDLSGVHTRYGDYVEGQLAHAMDRQELVGDIVEQWLKHAENRKTVVFATGVAHSVHVRDRFRDAGVLAEHIDGSTPLEERDRILAQLEAGEIEVVTNCMVLTEGWDQPSVSCLVLARPTRHMGLFRQMIGRGLRPAPDKTDCVVLDHAGAVFEHGFVEDPVEWTLDEDRRAESRVHKARGTYQAPALVTCPECHAVRSQGQPCPVCGWQPRPKPDPVEHADGELARVARDRTVTAALHSFDEQLRFFRQLLWIANERGYQRGWVAHKHKEKFGVWPPVRFAEPMIPEPAVRSWVKSRMIAYAKQMQAQRGDDD